MRKREHYFDKLVNLILISSIILIIFALFSAQYKMQKSIIIGITVVCSLAVKQLNRCNRIIRFQSKAASNILFIVLVLILILALSTTIYYMRYLY